MKRLALIILSLLLLAPTLTFAADSDAPAGALPCDYAVPEETGSYVSHLCDGDPFTTLTVHSGETLSVRPSGGAVSLYADLYEIHVPFELLYLDADGNALEKQTLKPSSPHLLLPLDAGVAEVRFVPTARDLVLSELYPCDGSFVPPFSDTDAHADVLAFLDRPGDELELFGGLFAQLAGEHGLSVQIVYVTETKGFELHQCL